MDNRKNRIQIKLLSPPMVLIMFSVNRTFVPAMHDC